MQSAVGDGRNPCCCCQAAPPSNVLWFEPFDYPDGPLPSAGDYIEGVRPTADAWTLPVAYGPNEISEIFAHVAVGAASDPGGATAATRGIPVSPVGSGWTVEADINVGSDGDSIAGLAFDVPGNISSPIVGTQVFSVADAGAVILLNDGNFLGTFAPVTLPFHQTLTYLPAGTVELLIDGVPVAGSPFAITPSAPPDALAAAILLAAGAGFPGDPTQTGRIDNVQLSLVP